MKETGYYIGIEREGLRLESDSHGGWCTSSGRHPSCFGDRTKNLLVTTDVGMAQLELRTLPCRSAEECYEKLSNLTTAVLGILAENGELMWPYSIPFDVPLEKDYEFCTGEEGEYEKALCRKYGLKRLLISGVHVNISVTDEMMKKLRAKFPSVPEDKDEAYFRCMRNFRRIENVLRPFFDASPVGQEGESSGVDSLRNSMEGHRNDADSFLDFSSKDAYAQSLKKMLDEGRIIRPEELYIPVRPKVKRGGRVLERLAGDGVDHIEIRLCDVDPFDHCGISLSRIRLMLAFFFYCYVSDEPVDCLGQILKSCLEVDSLLNLGLSAGIYDAMNEAACERKAELVRKMYNEKGWDGFIGLAKEYNHKALQDHAKIYPYPALEQSTAILIHDGLLMGLDYRIIDEKRSIVEFIEGSHKEIVVQATKTRLDSVLLEYITDDKIYSYEVMSKAGLRVPKTEAITKKDFEEHGEELIRKYSGRAFVVKPKSSNRSEGVSILRKEDGPEDIRAAAENAFVMDDTILMQEYHPEAEYRFLVIDGRCQSVIRWHKASVTGDGVHTIAELMEAKKKNPFWYLHEKGFPVDDEVRDLLQQQGKDFSSIPRKDECVMLRRILKSRTGAESEEYTDRTPERFKKIAEQAAQLFSGKVVGLDICIPDMNGEEYVIFEINDNPGLRGSERPVRGKRSWPGMDILRMLGFGGLVTEDRAGECEKGIVEK